MPANRFSFRIAPAPPKTRKSVWFVVLESNSERLLRFGVELLPFAERVGGYETAAILGGFPECWSGGNGLGLRIDCGKADLWILGPEGILLANSSETCRFILPGSFRWVCTRSSPFQKSMQPAVRYELGQLTQAFKFVCGGDYSARSACTGLIVDARFAGKNVANNPNTRSSPGTNTKVHGSF
jgi:hypothetical protein